jgi:hypothetical protein
MMLKYHDPSVTFSDVFEIFGYPPFDLEYYDFMGHVLETYPNLWVWDPCESEIEDLIENINNGYPVVVHMVFSLSESTGHNRVVIGYNLEQESIIVHDPTPANRVYRMNFDTFRKLWTDIVTLEPAHPRCMWVIQEGAPPY